LKRAYDLRAERQIAQDRQRHDEPRITSDSEAMELLRGGRARPSDGRELVRLDEAVSVLVLPDDDVRRRGGPG